MCTSLHGRGQIIDSYYITFPVIIVAALVSYEISNKSTLLIEEHFLKSRIKVAFVDVLCKIQTSKIANLPKERIHADVRCHIKKANA